MPMSSNVNQVVIHKGTYEYRGALGTAIVHAPHDVMLSDIEPVLTRLVRDCSDEDEKGRGEYVA